VKKIERTPKSCTAEITQGNCGDCREYGSVHNGRCWWCLEAAFEFEFEHIRIEFRKTISRIKIAKPEDFRDVENTK